MKACDKKYGVLFVCTGNICRSPTAEAFFHYHVEQVGLGDAFFIDSAGTQGSHVGGAPDNRAQSVLRERGIDMSSFRARRLEIEDFSKFDMIVAMDGSHMARMQSLASSLEDENCALLAMFLKFAPHVGRCDVPDPYYGGQEGFYHVLDMIEDASKGLLEHLRKSH